MNARASENLVEIVFENEVLVIVGGRQLDIFVYETVDEQLVLKDVRFQLVIVHDVDVVHADSQHASPDDRPPAQRTSALGELLGSSWRAIHRLRQHDGYSRSLAVEQLGWNLRTVVDARLRLVDRQLGKLNLHIAKTNIILFRSQNGLFNPLKLSLIHI